MKASLPWSTCHKKLPGEGRSCSIWPDVEVTEAVQPQVMVPLWATAPGLVGEGGPSFGNVLFFWLQQPKNMASTCF